MVSRGLDFSVGSLRYHVAFSLLLLLGHCTAKTDFESDSEDLALLLGFSEMGGCAELRYLGPQDYGARIMSIPSWLCTTETRSGTSYSHYIEIQRKEHELIASKAPLYESAACSDEVAAVQAYPDDPSLLSPQGFDQVRSAADYPNTRWQPIANPVQEGRNHLLYHGLTDAQLNAARNSTYAEYLSFMAGLYVSSEADLNSDAVCQADVWGFIDTYHPGWVKGNLMDTAIDRTQAVIYASACFYGAAGLHPEERCLSSFPEFNG